MEGGREKEGEGNGGREGGREGEGDGRYRFADRPDFIIWCSKHVDNAVDLMNIRLAGKEGFLQQQLSEYASDSPGMESSIKIARKSCKTTEVETSTDHMSIAVVCSLLPNRSSGARYLG